MSPRLVLGPMLRYAGEREATVWVETDDPCEVEVLGHRDRTFCVEGHHYAIVCVEGLEPGSATEYEVALDGERRWPDPELGLPPSAIRTIRRGDPLRIAFGSCRVCAPHDGRVAERPRSRGSLGRGADALRSLALRMRDRPELAPPHLLLMLGDQVYADDVSPATRAFIQSRRDPSRPPGEEVVDFEEYAHLYL
ncbi:MAG TPA: hypothetical protein VGR10_04325, partial [Thermoleophilaceae bacterium]|nr:hypothetical protein [Thermoleophilaceae bacterium]